MWLSYGIRHSLVQAELSVHSAGSKIESFGCKLPNKPIFGMSPMSSFDDDLANAKRLLDSLGREHKEYLDAKTLYDRLKENIANEDLHGVNGKAERSQIRSALNKICLKNFQVTIDQLEENPKHPIVRRAPSAMSTGNAGVTSVETRGQPVFMPDVSKTDELTPTEAIHQSIGELAASIRRRRHFELGALPEPLEEIYTKTKEIYNRLGELKPVYLVQKRKMTEQNVYSAALKAARDCRDLLDVVRSRSAASEENTKEFLNKLGVLEQSVSALLQLEKRLATAASMDPSRPPTSPTADPTLNGHRTFAELWKEELARIQDNDDNLQLLLEQLTSGIGVIPFVGAGFSVPTGFPGWGDFLMAEAAKAGTSTKKVIKKLLDAGQYEEAAEKLSKERGFRAFYDAIDNTFGARKLRGKPIQGAVVHVPRLAAGPVITTNFDGVLERVFEEAGSPFKKVISGTNAHMAAKAFTQQRRDLLKIHGDAEDSTHRILTKQDYAKHYGAGPSIDFALPLPHLLRQILSGRPILFLGCSLNQDRTVGILAEVTASAPHVPHYAIVEQPATEKQFLVRARFLSNHNIRPIWYPNGRFDLIEPLVAFLLEKKTSLRA